MDYEWVQQFFQHDILSSHASVILSDPVTCTWYLSVIGHSLFTVIIKDADLCDIISALAKMHLMERQLTASVK